VNSQYLGPEVFLHRLKALLLPKGGGGGGGDYVSYGIEKVVREDVGRVRLITELVLGITLETSGELPLPTGTVVLDELFKLAGLKLFDPVKIFPSILKSTSENLRKIEEMPTYFMRFLLLVKLHSKRVEKM
jgi:hypothetical protein